jgi:energy-coupling factor transporter ATP-binding protein EcfA2
MLTNDKMLHDALAPIADDAGPMACYDASLDDVGFMHLPTAASAAAEEETLARLIAPPHEAKRERRTFKTLGNEQTDEALEMLYNADPGLSWAWDELTEITDTIKPGDLVVVSAYTGSGKTTFVQNNTAAWSQMGEKVLMFGTEQKAAALRFKMACMRIGVNFSNAVRGRLDRKWTLRLEQAIKELNQAPFDNVSFYPDSSPTLNQVIVAIRAAHKAGIRTSVLDHLGCMCPDREHASMTRWAFNGMAVQQLKDLCTELGHRLIIAAQLMSGDEGGDAARHTRPQLNKIQGGQMIAQFADLVIAIFQPQKTGVGDEAKLAVKRGEADLSTIVEPNTATVVQLKHREGMPPRMAMFWVKNNRFTPRRHGETLETLPISEYERDNPAPKIWDGPESIGGIELATPESRAADAEAKRVEEERLAAEKKAEAKAERARRKEEKRKAKSDADEFLKSVGAAMKAGMVLRAQPMPLDLR